MKKLSVKNQIKILEYAKEYITDKEEGICVGIQNGVNEIIKKPYCLLREVPFYFPDLNKYKPKRSYNEATYWWNWSKRSMAIRVKIINAMIKARRNK